MFGYIEFEREKCLKEKFLYAAAKSVEAGNSRDVYSGEMLQALRDMAEWDIFPDWRFSDLDCNIWSMFHCFHAKEA